MASPNSHFPVVPPPTRRHFFERAPALLALTLGLALASPLAAAGDDASGFGPAKPFSFDTLVEDAKQMAAGAYGDGAPPRAEKTIEKIDYDAFNKIKFRPERSLKIRGTDTPIRFFPLQRYAKKSVHIYLVEDEKSREVLYSPEYFDMPADSPAKALPADIGFAGFHVQEPGEKDLDFMAFMGAAYFRTSGELDQFGLSARAAAIDTATERPEEFPRFTSFYFGAAKGGGLMIYALMDSPSLTGAVRFDVQRGKGVLMNINSRFFARKDIKRLGLAPLTSMFWYSEYSRRLATDWRPEIHDSDGLAIWTGSGERLWRPLNNPAKVMTSSFVDRAVRGFGFCQRDRDFDHYQDDWVSYDKRPTCWVDPLGDWGPGAVQLVEIPTDDEIYDNIVAYWVPEKPVKAGDPVSIDYRLHWVKDEPYPPPAGRVFSSRVGAGGVPGAPRPPGVMKFIVDFEGGLLPSLTIKDHLEAVISASSGKVSGIYCVPVTGTARWRAGFDLTPASLDPVELRLFVKKGDTALTETWLSQYHPVTLPAAASKK